MIRVAAAIISRDDGTVLLCRRRAGKKLAGKWEFPGGKIEEGESAAQALVRELDEELGLRVEPGEQLMTVTHAYDFGTIELTAVACRVGRFGSLTVTDHDRLDWVHPVKLLNYDLAAADVPIAKRLSRP